MLLKCVSRITGVVLRVRPEVHKARHEHHLNLIHDLASATMARRTQLLLALLDE
jgi:hypothetical protein